MPKNSLSFNDIIKLVNGEKIIREIPIRFFKSLKNLSINIKPTKITITANSNKKLINNIYLPLHIINLNHKLDNRSKLIKFINKIKLYLKHILTKLL